MTNLCELLENAALRAPDSTAFFDDKTVLSYTELLDISRRTGSALNEMVQPGSVIALMLDSRSIYNIPAIFGVLYSGCAYAPLDISMPKERIDLLLSLMQPALIIADAKGASKADNCVLFEALAAHEFTQPPVCPARGDDMASILYTSGSTGIPKGSVQTHMSYLKWTNATNRMYGFDEHTVFGNQSPFFYANSIIDIFCPIELCAKTYMLPPGVLTFPRKFIACLNDNHVTELTMTPSSFVSVVNAGVLEKGCLPYLKYGIMSGEPMPWSPLAKWMEATPGASWWHFYGSTEMFSVAVGKVAGEPEPGRRLPVGRLFNEVKLRFSDDGSGEMLVSSPWVSTGYYLDKERTEKSWIAFPDGIYYKSGDNGYIAPDGQLIVTGRADSQIKHMGYRMELGEVQAALDRTGLCLEGCILYDRESDKIWCFYSGNADEKQMRKEIGAYLARYMVPDVFMRLDEMPHTSGMKLDRVKLTSIMKEKC